MSTTTCGTPRSLFSLPTWSALAVGLALTVALPVASPSGQAHAQTAPPDPTVPGDAAPAPAPSTTEAEGNPLAEKQLDQIRQMVSSMPKVFVFQGYLRAGTGINSDGGQQVAFKAPGAFTKYRLGNETELYGEIGLDANWINPTHGDGAWFKTSIKLAVIAPRNQTFDVLSTIALREGYGEAGHVIESHPEMTVWAGTRFYRRKDVHIIDFFFQDMSGYGAGFQDLKVGDKAKLAVAYLGGATPYNGGEMSADLGKLYKSTVDIRLYDVPAGPGNLELWLIPTAAASGSLAADVANNRSGIGGGVFYNMPFMGGFNEISGEFGYGGAANLSTGIDRSIASGGWLARVVERAAVQASPQLSMMWTGVFQLDNRNGSTNGSGGNLWISAGARPVYMLSKYTGVAFEGGVDLVKAEAPAGATVDLGVLAKLTVAGVVRPAADFWARPELRVFVTAATWNDPIKDTGGPAGGVGIDGNLQPSANPYLNKNFGLTAGVQMESWW
jgi:maltoporin